MIETYNHNSPNWGEDEIKNLSKRYGVGRLIKVVCTDKNGNPSPQVKFYDEYPTSFPDYINSDDTNVYMFVEVKSRSEFYKDNLFLAIKKRSFNSYRRVQIEEGKEVRVVYLIGNKDKHEIFWCKLKWIMSMEYSTEMFKDKFDIREEPYYFFHSSQLNRDIVDLFNPYFKDVEYG